MEEKLMPHQLNRRSGRTTRAIDEMVQHLFNNGVVQLSDHADRPDNLAFDSMKRVFFDRLSREHHLSLMKGLAYDEKHQTVRLLNTNS